MASHPPQALRLTFDHQDGQIRLIGSERIDMIVPAPTTAPPEPGQTGYWLGVRDAAGRVIYHRPLHDPIKVDAEVFSPDPRQSIARVPSAARTGRFTVLIPDLADAHSVELQGPADSRRSDAPSGELLRLDMDALRSANPRK